VHVSGGLTVNVQLGAEFVWFYIRKRLTMAIYVKPGTVRDFHGSLPTEARVSNMSVQVVSNSTPQVVYRCPTTLVLSRKGWSCGPVFAILAGSESYPFQGSQLNFRDIMQAAKARKIFMYVLPAASVTSKAEWTGFVRLGYQKWTGIPCPRPQAVYNRVPTRYLERRPQTIVAKQQLKTLGIPVFNPDYFNKATIYDVLRTAGYDNYLPQSSGDLNKPVLSQMLQKLNRVYLKPAGGSVGHGMMLISRSHPGGFTIQTLKNGICDMERTDDFLSLWQIVNSKRVPGKYVVQEAIPLITWQGRPCDFRILLQKDGGGKWAIAGKGVRVSGPNTITTHVPNGGYIAEAAQVLQGIFASSAARTEERLDNLVIECGEAIDDHYQGTFGEMSMDVGIDMNGRPWFFEANAKPMKFDEPSIRTKSISGVIDYLWYLKELNVPPGEE
jgi:hypothetical protein